MTIIERYELTQRAIADGKARYISADAKRKAENSYIEQIIREELGWTRFNVSWPQPRGRYKTSLQLTPLF